MAAALLGAVLLLAAVLAVTFVGLSNSPARSSSGATASHGRSASARGSSVDGSGAAARTRAGTGTAAGTATPAATTTLAPWQLAAPVGEEAVLPGPGGGLVVLGGSTTGGALANGIFALDTATGKLRQAGDLQAPLADAAASVIDGSDVVLGGRSSAPVATVQGLTTAATGLGTAPATTVATILGSLPAPRAGAVAVSVGTTTYVVGGTSAAGPQAAVLATTDGRTFTEVATLPQAVAFAAVAVANGKIYVLGGLTLTGPGAGRPTAAIEVVDPVSHRVRNDGTLPVALWGAGAVTLEGHVLVAGGSTTTLPAGTSAGSPSSSVSAQGAIWSFEPSTRTVHAAGHLAVPVAEAGMAVVGTTAWVVGGESGGSPVSTVQSFTVH